MRDRLDELVARDAILVAAVGGSVRAGFLAERLHVQLDLVVSDPPVDIVAEGFDAGIQLGELIDKDVTAVPVTTVSCERHARSAVAEVQLLSVLKALCAAFPEYYLYHPVANR